MTPIHTVERLVAMGIMTVGVFFFGFLIGALAELVQARLTAEAQSSNTDRCVACTTTGSEGLHAEQHLAGMHVGQGLACKTSSGAAAAICCSLGMSTLQLSRVVPIQTPLTCASAQSEAPILFVVLVHLACNAWPQHCHRSQSGWQAGRKQHVQAHTTSSGSLTGPMDAVSSNLHTTTILLQAASSSASRAALLHTKIKAVEAWLHARKLPRELRADVTSYFSDTWVDSAGRGMPVQPSPTLVWPSFT